jgi:aminoglycoside 6-adenylyltransferase
MLQAMQQGYADLTERLVAWAEAAADVRAVFVIGSRARTERPADAWSDLDVILLVHDPSRYRTATEWLHHIGTPWLTFIEPTPTDEGFERRVLFEGGLDVDFVPEAVTGFELLLEHGLPPAFADLVQRGVRFLVDKDGFAARLDALAVSAPPFTPPSEAEFLNLVHDFWYHTVWTGKHLRRGELWWGKSCCDGYLKDRLRRMLAWHTRATQGAQVDTWMRGRFLEDWCDPRARAALPEIFAHYDEDDVWRALHATMDLFQWVACETAQAWDYAYPHAGEDHARDLVRAMFEGRPSVHAP